MPTSRRSTGGARAKAGPGTNQSTISFASKVSKPTTKDTGKKAIISDQPTHKKPAKVSVSPTATSPKSEPEPVSPTVEEGDDDVDVSPYAEVETPTATEKPEFEIEAGKVSDAQVKKYWKGIEAEGTVKRVHQEDLSVTEKILRYFDMSSEYGVCILPPLFSGIRINHGS